eukprot:TRINITY_DN115_c0_g2_i1.p1 TRINITY_DN115_c0_g2~~TRINITY_DN115_c0_g2_i1.p1  ORF type:complete len:413 (+),score=63.44 TRINITY_DN115_c0_g2_i1:377-1615(+)
MECAYYYQSHLDVPINTYNMDQDLDPLFKESWCKRVSPLTMRNYKRHTSLDIKIPDVVYSETTQNPKIQILIDYSRDIGKLIQMNSPGYLPNIRQHRFAGLATIEIAQTLRAVWKQGKDMVPENVGSVSKAAHKFGWRDMYDICVRWRQFSEPNDPVWWVDMLTSKQFNEGFGSHTPLITKQAEVVRYYPEFKRAFGITKRLMSDQCNLNSTAQKKLKKAKDCKDLYDIMKKDFFVITPCYSLARPGKYMEGTRLTLQNAPPEGFEYSIRTPGTPARWAEFHHELTFLFNQLSQEAKKPDLNLERASDLILSITFYWYNFLALSRGAASCGQVGLLGMFLALGYKIPAEAPTGLMPDWEAILRPRPQEYIDALKPWIYTSRTAINCEEFDKLPKVSEVFTTLRTVIEGLNVK